VSSAPAEDHKVLSTDQFLGFFSPLPGAITPTSTATSQPVHANQLIQVADDGIIASELMSLGYNCKDQPIRPGASRDNKTLHAPSLNPSPISNFCSSSERNGSLPLTSTLNGIGQSQHGADADSLRLTDLQYLARLPHSVLKEISNAIDKALIIAKTETAQKSPEPGQGTQDQLLRGKKLQNIGSGSKGIFKCEHPGCNRNFRHNKDRLRHVRQKHAKDAKTFICPVVDCPMGFKHEFHRTDKLRDHLCGDRISSYQWACVIPGCSEVVASRIGLINHLGGHENASRHSNYNLLADYGFVPRSTYSAGYFLASHICSIEGCPFGTDDEACISSHESIPHDGSICTCPIPDCQVVYEDWSSVSEHLARAHNYITRQRFKEAIVSQRHDPDLAIIICQICSHEIINQTPREVRDHLKTHSLEQRLQCWEAILNAWIFAVGPKVPLKWELGTFFYGRGLTLTGDMTLAYFNLSDEELSNLITKEDFIREGKKLRPSFDEQKWTKLLSVS
jgi:uncharacterized C2H2 Zn-finger protein